MQITVRGEMTIAKLRQAIYEKLNELEDDFAVQFSHGATVYVNPTDGKGNRVVPRDRYGGKIDRLQSDGPYQSAAEDLKI